MTKTHAKFLEELKRYLNREIKTFETSNNDWSAGHVRAFESVQYKIEQFESEQKKVEDEQKHI